MAWRKPRYVHIELYDIEIELYDSISLAVSWTKGYEDGISQKDVEGAGGATGVCKRDGDEIVVMIIPEHPDRHTLLVHETVHAAHFILDSRGVPISMENTEASAYLQDNIYKKCAIQFGMKT